MNKIGIAGLVGGAILAAMAGVANAEISERTIRVGSTLTPEHPNGIAVEAMAKCAADRTGGKMTIQGIHNAALGGDQEMSQAARAGTLDMFMTTTSPLAGLEPKLGVFDLPFLFNNPEEALAVLDGEFGEYLSGLMPQHGLVNLGYWDYGVRQITNSKRPIKAVEDLSGLRMRVMQNNVFIDSFSALGANPIPMSWGEVFPALETGAIDGQENPILTIADAQLADVQDYVSKTNHVYSAVMLMYSGPLWEKLSAEEQAVVTECAAEATKVQRSEMAGRVDAAYKKVIEAGMEVNEVEPAVIDAMRAKLASVYEKHSQSVGADVVERLNAAIAKVRK
ncbi:DctP family TRAP transporter solute-binding subunit [Arvimicrobium flavum]|uniref:DctP family TRAP transporter solute-binding subunit n=1 Tax=Arvimicrobium flavum TaxID=3393320 RepID=UPI00237AB71E|nr:DctP family TRAP transporter solute-binding subunit [Mesorhizobium shangrilense]